MSGRWRNSAERSRILEKDCDDFASKLQLVDAREDGQFGRWYLRAPHTWAEVVTLRGGIYVGGDIETVVFQGGGDRAGHPRGRVYWMATRSYSYAAEKAHRTTPDEWDWTCAQGAIVDHRRHDQLTKEQARWLYDRVEDMGRGEFQALVYDETGDAELCDMGDVTARRIYMATAILRRLAYLFDCGDFRASAHEWFRRAA